MLLVSLCFVAVMGIVLGSYLAVCSRAMNLSNRSFQAGLSKQLAEAGIEEALRAFNTNNWSDWSNSGTTTDWTLDTTNKRATATITYPATKFGQGVTATVKLRVDNYDARVLGSTWISSKNYRIGDQIGYNGIWYSCVRNHVNQAPTADNFTNWVPSHVPWEWDSAKAYKTEEMVNYNGTWYRCIAANTNQAPPNANWQSAPTVFFSPSIDYTHQAILNWYSYWYRYNAGSWDSAPAVSWRYRTGYNYSFDDLVYYNYIWYRFINGTPTANITPGSNAAYWENALTGDVHGWKSSSIDYNIGDVVYYSSTSQWYRCIAAHTSSGSITPTNPSYWTNTPLLNLQWSVGPYYTAGDVVIHNGVWYRCILTHTSTTSITPTNTSYWIGADTTNTNHRWNATTAYSVGAYRCYDGVWYRCLVANTGQSPNNTTYWTATWAQSSGVTTGAPVVYGEAIVNLGDGTTSRTQVRVPISLASLFPNAAGVTTTLTIGSAGGTVDSYDNTLGTGYVAQIDQTTNFSAVLASTGTSNPAITINSTTSIKGYVAALSASSSPFGPMVSISGGTNVKGPNSPAAPNTDPSRVSRSPYVPQFDALPKPSLASAFSASSFPRGLALGTNPLGAISIGTAGAVTPARYFFNGTLNVGSSGTHEMATLNINGPVILHVNGNFRIHSGGSVVIGSAGSLELHANGGIRIDEASAGIKNDTIDPKKAVLISDITTTATHYYDDTTNPFYGVIYTPKTTATLGLNIDTGVTLYGALSASKITFTDEATLHYDTSLRHAVIPGVDQPYTVSTWRELPATEAATMP